MKNYKSNSNNSAEKYITGISYINLSENNEVNNEGFRQKAQTNIALFSILLEPNYKENYARLKLQKPTGENKKLMQRLSEITYISPETVEVINAADELLNISPNFQRMFGCTSVGKNGVIGQTMDLFTVELSIVREGNNVYVTMPPYLALMGMNEHIAFCTNHLPAEVNPGVPVAQLRRNILRQETIEDAIKYLENVPRTTNVNFLVSDGTKMIDIESTPAKLIITEAIPTKDGKYLAHTNHIIEGSITKDRSCPRLMRAAELLSQGAEISTILDDRCIDLPIQTFGRIGFGSIIKTIMDVKNKSIYYKEPGEKTYSYIRL